MTWFSKQKQITNDGNVLSRVTGVPVVGGKFGHEFARHDFKEPLEVHEIERINRHFGSRVIMTVEDKQVYLRDK